MRSFAVSIVIFLLSSMVYGEQYRSKLLIDPAHGLGENVELSIEELEKQFGNIAEGYAKSSAGQHLAHHYVKEQRYDKAIEYYEAALNSKGLSDIINQQLRQELSSVYLLTKQPKKALATLQQVGTVAQIENVDVLLAYAQASYQSKQFRLTSDAIERAVQLESQPDADFYRQVLALSYGAGDYLQSETVLKSWLKSDSENQELWIQLVSLFLKQGKFQDALAALILVEQKGLPMQEKQILLMADLASRLDNPFRAGITLSNGLASGSVGPTGENYHRLFGYWMLAQEDKKAEMALEQAAVLSSDIDLYLHWIQLLMEQEQWQKMNQAILILCKSPVPAHRVSRVRLFLGISELKIGNREKAKDAFISATVDHGENEKAGKWLASLEKEDGLVPKDTSFKGTVIRWLSFMGDDEYDPTRLAKAKGPCKKKK